MSETQPLLEAYVRHGSEAAFRELVERYVNFVYSTARRLVDGNSQLAEDVTQTVFINLARHARTLSSAVALGGWLHRHTFHLATKALRAERRRQNRERTAMALTEMEQESQESWESLSPVLDDAINRLPSEDRQAILLRFFEQRDFRSVGLALGSSEDAARMRVQRALGKLHLLLRQRGLSVTGASLAAALVANTISAAPAGLAATATTVALTSAAAGVGMTMILSMTTTKLTLAALVVAGAATTFVHQHHAGVQQRSEIGALRQQLDTLQAANESLSNRLGRAARTQIPRLPAPAVVSTTAAVLSPDALGATNLYSLMTNKDLKVSAAQLAPYLEANHRNASSLLAAFRTCGDPALLAEAMQNFPDHPQVDFEAALRKDASPEERRRWLDAFKRNAPENALPHYLSASEYFKAGQVDSAVQELVAASGKAEFKDYSLERLQDDEEAYRAAGYSVPQSKLVANMQLLLPQLVQIKDLSSRVVDLANSYGQAGDQASRQSALEMAAALGRRYSDGSPGQTLLSELVGVAVERSALTAMEAGSAYNGGAQTVQERLDELGQRRAAIRELNRQAEPLWRNLNDHDWISYQSRSLAFGEHSALEWLVSKNAQP